MHQEHNIPWYTVASHFKFIRENPHITPRRTSIFPRQLPTQGASLNHFKRVFLKTITTFSSTERQKYPTSFPTPASGKLFSDELRDRHPEFLNERNQSIEHWIKSYAPLAARGYEEDWEFADAVKVLLSENEMEPLLMLAQHPQIPLRKLRSMGCGNDSGFVNIQYSALHSYIEFNLWAAMGLLEGGEYLETYDYQQILRKTIFHMGDSREGHQVPHRAYFGGLPKDQKTGLPIVHKDFGRLKEYLKTNFRLLYCYDMLMKECGLDPNWESYIVISFGGDMIGWGVRLESTIQFA